MKEDKMSAVRGPMVTATGIILGFLLNYVASWVRTDQMMLDWQAYFITGCVLVGTSSLIYVLFRILSINFESNQAMRHYQKTLYLFIWGISIAFLGFFTDILINFMAD